MTTHVNDAGTWRTLTGVYVNDAGTWREIAEIYVNDSGTWRSVYVNDGVSIENLSSTSVVSGVQAEAWYRLTNSGDIQAMTGTNTVVDVGDWISPKTGMANYEVRATVNSGSPLGTFGAWQSLATTRLWLVVQAGVGTSAATITVEIRRASDATLLDSAVITLSATISS